LKPHRQLQAESRNGRALRCWKRQASGHAARLDSTVGEYFGEARVNLNGPDPALLLVDIDRVEVLKGPQGTLYGGGTLGGVLRIVPEPPDLKEAGGSIDVSSTWTEHGSPGQSVATVLNVPLVEDSIGVRAVVYRSIFGGYIDDVGRNRTDVNRTAVDGARVALRSRLGGWTIDMNGTHQRIASRDSQYVDADGPALSRESTLPQPFRSSFDLISLDGSRSLDSVDLLTTTAGLRQRLEATYDATSLTNIPARFLDNRRIFAFSHETRLSRSRKDGSGWLLGIALLQQDDSNFQNNVPAVVPELASVLSTKLFNGAFFGQYSYRAGRFLAVAGGRLTYQHISLRSNVVDQVLSLRHVQDESARALPMARLSWFVSPMLSTSIGYRESYRTRGATVVHGGPITGVSSTMFYPFGPDHLRTIDLNIGVRGGGPRRPALDATLSVTHWNDVQTDVLDALGLIGTENGSDVELINLDLTARWPLATALTVAGTASMTRGFFPSYRAGIHEIPNIPSVAVHGEATWSHALGQDATLSVLGQANYRSASRLGAQALHAIEQGRTLSTTLAVNLERGRWSMNLRLENLLDDDSNLFGYGNPFTVLTQRQETPQRPRNLTIGGHVRF
jgi:iron complex outermembrane receptor protein